MIKVKAYLDLMRIQNSIATVIAVLIGALVAGENIFIPSVFFATLVAFFIVAGGFSINDYYDLEIDKINNKKRPIPRGDISPLKAKIFGYSLLAIGIVLSIFSLPFITFYIASISAFLLIQYSRNLKHKHTIIGNFVTSYSTAITFVFGWSCLLSVLTNQVFLTLLFMFLISLFACLGREFIKSIQDVEGDSKNNVKNIAVLFGLDKAALFALSCMLITFVLTPIPYILNLFNIYYLIIMLIVASTAIILSINLLIKTNKNRTKSDLYHYAERVKINLLILMGIGILSFGIGLFPFN